MSDVKLTDYDGEFGCGDPDDWSSDTEACPDCEGADDPFYCSTCKNRGWIYVEMLNAPHLSHWDVEQELRKQRERDAGRAALAQGDER